MYFSPIKLQSQVDTSYVASPDQLGPEALIMYLQTRLDSLDSQINSIFEKQKKIEGIRKALGEINNALAELDDDTSNKNLINGGSKFEDQIRAAIDRIEALDPALAKQIRADFDKEGQILNCTDGKYYTREVEASKTYVNNMVKQLESSAQMEMIRLQSLSSARGTAISMSTNLLASFSEGPKAIVNNLR